MPDLQLGQRKLAGGSAPSPEDRPFLPSFFLIFSEEQELEFQGLGPALDVSGPLGSQVFMLCAGHAGEKCPQKCGSPRALAGLRLQPQPPPPASSLQPPPRPPASAQLCSILQLSSLSPSRISLSKICDVTSRYLSNVLNLSVLLCLISLYPHGYTVTSAGTDHYSHLEFRKLRSREVMRQPGP